MFQQYEVLDQIQFARIMVMSQSKIMFQLQAEGDILVKMTNNNISDKSDSFSSTL